MHRSSPNWAVLHPRKGVCGGAKIKATPYYSQHAVFPSLRALFHLGKFCTAEKPGFFAGQQKFILNCIHNYTAFNEAGLFCFAANRMITSACEN